MPLPQGANSKPLGCLSRPQLSSVGGGRDQAPGIHTLDGVSHRRRSNHCIALKNRLGTAIKQGRIDKTTGSIMDQHMRGIPGKGHQPPLHRFLPGSAPFNPVDRFWRTLQQGCNGSLIERLADDTDPADRWGVKSCIQRPGKHRPASQWQQKFVAVRPHAPAASSCSDQQMHKRLLLPAG